MENGAKGVEVIISGKLRAQRAKAMKFRRFAGAAGYAGWFWGTEKYRGF